MLERLSDTILRGVSAVDALLPPCASINLSVYEILAAENRASSSRRTQVLQWQRTGEDRRGQERTGEDTESVIMVVNDNDGGGGDDDDDHDDDDN